MKKTSAQRQRQRERDRTSGRYVKNPCYGCGRGAPMEYFSHVLTDELGSDGSSFADILLVMCRKCALATQNLTTVKEVMAYQKKHKGVN